MSKKTKIITNHTITTSDLHGTTITNSFKTNKNSTMWWPTNQLAWKRMANHTKILMQAWQGDMGHNEWREVEDMIDDE